MRDRLWGKETHWWVPKNLDFVWLQLPYTENRCHTSHRLSAHKARQRDKAYGMLNQFRNWFSAKYTSISVWNCKRNQHTKVDGLRHFEETFEALALMEKQPAIARQTATEEVPWSLHWLCLFCYLVVDQRLQHRNGMHHFTHVIKWNMALVHCGHCFTLISTFVCHKYDILVVKFCLNLWSYVIKFPFFGYNIGNCDFQYQKFDY